MLPIQNTSGINPFNTDMPVASNHLGDSLLSDNEKNLEMLFEKLESIDPDKEPEKCDLYLEKIENLIKNSSTIKDKNEQLSNVLELKQRLKSTAYFSNRDVIRTGEIGGNVFKTPSKNPPLFTSQLAKADELIPPMGNAKFSSEEREHLLQQIAFLKIGNQQEKIGPGCTLVINLIADELRESYIALQRICRTQDEKAVLSVYKMNIESLIGSLCLASSTLCKFKGTLDFKTVKKTPEMIQNQFVGDRQLLISDEGIPLLHSSIIQKILTRTAEGKRCLSAFSLLEDFATQEMNRLFSPLTNSFDLSKHFTRLHRRTDCFQRVLEGKEGYDCFEKSYLKKYEVSLNRQNASLINFCKLIIPEIVKLQKKNDPQNLINLWNVLKCKFDMDKDQPSLFRLLTADLQKKPDDPQLNLLVRYCTRILWSYQTLVDEIYLVMLINLINASQVTNQEIDAYIESFIEVSATTDRIRDNIKLRLESIPEDGDSFANFLHAIWEVDEDIRENWFLPGIHQLETRLNYCRKKPTDQIERVLALRDILNLLSNTAFAQAFERGSDFYETTSVEQEKVNSQLLSLQRDMRDLNIMQQQRVLAAVEGIKTLIGRCFTRMESYIQIEDEKVAKTFDLQSLQARETGNELIKSQKKSGKKKSGKGKKRIINLEPASAKEKSQPKPFQKVISSPKVVTIDRTQKSIVAEGNKDLVKQTTPKNQTESGFENLLEVSVILLNCAKQLNILKDSEIVRKGSWQYNQIQDFEFLIESLMEIQVNEGFSVDLIFEQTDLLRRSIESLLGIVTIFTETSHDEVKSNGHDTEKLLCFLMNSTTVPENIRKLLWRMRNVPISFAEGNRCVNYPAEANAKQERLNDDGRQLINLLMEVDREGRAQQVNEDLRILLTAQLNLSLQRSTYFMDRLLAALLDPSKIIDGELPLEDLQKVSEKSSVITESPSLDGLAESQLLSEDRIENKIKIFTISTREEALLAIDTALVWIGIRCMAPVEGYPLLQWRTDERNIALRNSGIYLRRLKEKLGPDRNLRPMSTILGQCQLMRRCQKELIIAALYHTDSFVDGQHIVQARDIRFENSPCVLMSILRNVSTCSKDLPSIGNWMHRAHNILSYPASQGQREGDFSASQLQNFIIEVRKASRELRQFSPDETLVLGNGKLKTPEKRLQERIELVKANESERIFPGLAAFLHTLKYGLSLPKHKYLNSNK